MLFEVANNTRWINANHCGWPFDPVVSSEIAVMRQYTAIPLRLLLFASFFLIAFGIIRVNEIFGTEITTRPRRILHCYSDLLLSIGLLHTRIYFSGVQHSLYLYHRKRDKQVETRVNRIVWKLEEWFSPIGIIGSSWRKRGARDEHQGPRSAFRQVGEDYNVDRTNATLVSRVVL